MAVTLRGRDERSHYAPFLVDSGGGGFLIVEPLAATQLGLNWQKTQEAQGSQLGIPSVSPSAFVGEMPLELDPGRVFIMIGKDNMLPASAPGRAAGMLPGHVLARYQVIFDYPKSTFTLAVPGSLTPRGQALPMPISKQMGFPRTDVEVDGESHGFLLDTGASFTMVSEATLKGWGNLRNRPPSAPADRQIR